MLNPDPALVEQIRGNASAIADLMELGLTAQSSNEGKPISADDYAEAAGTLVMASWELFKRAHPGSERVAMVKYRAFMKRCALSADRILAGKAPRR